MRSFAALVAAFALLNFASASPLKEFSLDDPSLLGRDYPLLDKREARAEAVSRIAATKARNAKKARALEYEKHFNMVERAIEEMAKAEGLTKRDLERRDIHRRAVAKVQCGVGAKASTPICVKYALASEIPANGRVACNSNTGRCQIVCNNNYTLRNGFCYKNANICTGKVCPAAPRNGVYLCTPGPRCTLVCNFGQTPNAAGTACVNTKFDANNCGAEGNVCPPSYNGIGSVHCWNFRCGITCPNGYYRRTSSTGQYYCSTTQA
ncbi:hypothetical protein BCR35DRAFT_304148 [Leucosporidium creatinivorum]|uniref:Uncharacterized protein n=1 Tax=Leucosporidium creatinivorum TaxID=106004 RepID=A0A1Y2FEL3_9BASI|nr:hypothetical protein BCR35DRAFT_304148 [Leucosporidium creatinivorum]